MKATNAKAKMIEKNAPCLANNEDNEKYITKIIANIG